MAVKKAIEHIDFLLEKRQKFIEGMLDPSQPWNKGEDVVSRMVNTMAEELQKDVKWLRAIKKQLLPVQHLTKIVCRHPKKDQTIDPDGQKYCMCCNANL